MDELQRLFTIDPLTGSDPMFTEPGVPPWSQVATGRECAKALGVRGAERHVLTEEPQERLQNDRHVQENRGPSSVLLGQLDLVRQDSCHVLALWVVRLIKQG